MGIFTGNSCHTLGRIISG